MNNSPTNPEELEGASLKGLTPNRESRISSPVTVAKNIENCGSVYLLEASVTKNLAPPRGFPYNYRSL